MPIHLLLLAAGAAHAAKAATVTAACAKGTGSAAATKSSTAERLAHVADAVHEVHEATSDHKKKR